LKNNSTTEILKIIDSEPRISHRLIAEHTNNQQKNIVELINKYTDKFELFGAIPFETEVLKAGRGTTKSRTYFLNESQATLLMTFLRNNEIVVNFKVALVQAFYEMRKQLQVKTSQKETPQTDIQLPQILQQTKEALQLLDILKGRNGFDLLLLEKILKESSPTKLLEMDFSQTYFLPTELGKLIGVSGAEMNLILEKRGFQIREDGVWRITESGKGFGLEVGGSFNQIKWKLESVG
jgi:phage regulator Rha-like protein